MTTLPISSAYRDAIRVALLLQIPIALLLLLIMDNGVLAKIGGCSMAGFWLGTAVIMFRRTKNPQPIDLLYIRYGYAIMLVCGFICASIVVAHRGTGWPG